jgi:hypothetical protein
MRCRNLRFRKKFGPQIPGKDRPDIRKSKTTVAVCDVARFLHLGDITSEVGAAVQVIAVSPTKSSAGQDLFNNRGPLS